MRKDKSKHLSYFLNVKSTTETEIRTIKQSQTFCGIIYAVINKRIKQQIVGVIMMLQKNVF